MESNDMPDFNTQQNDFTISRNEDETYDIKGLSVGQMALIFSTVKIAHSLADTNPNTPEDMHDAVKHFEERFHEQMMDIIVKRMISDEMSNQIESII